jgi:hypothetical protein
MAHSAFAALEIALSCADARLTARPCEAALVVIVAAVYADSGTDRLSTFQVYQ